jgi:hypothetical protein
MYLSNGLSGQHLEYMCLSDGFLYPGFLSREAGER